MIKLEFEISGSPMEKQGVTTKADVSFHKSTDHEILWVGVIQATLDALARRGKSYENIFNEDAIEKIREEATRNYVAIQRYRASLN
ncbi:MAG: hypothetical protein ACXABD_22155 [Candidatus Thorarchaeota archaeon]